MNIRHLMVKGFDSGVSISKTVVYEGVPLAIRVDQHSEFKPTAEETIEFNRSYPVEINTVQSLENGKRKLLSSPIGRIVASAEGDILSLSKVYDYKVVNDDVLSKVLPEGATFGMLVESEFLTQYFNDIAKEMFPEKNPLTCEDDIDTTRYYTKYIPLVSMSGCIPPQMTEDGKAYFNPEGTVTVAEFLDGLNSINYGSNANNRRKKTLDNISNETDYFNEGYQECLRGISSPFFNLYTRLDLLEPITRIEMAYITVICWRRFIEKFNNLYGGTYYLGVNFDWENPSDLLSKFKDGFDYKVSRIRLDSEYDILSLDLKDYRSDRTMSEYKENLRCGISPIPLPMFMSLIEIGILDLFMFEDGNLNPLREVSRGEFCYFLAKLAELFPSKYFN